MANDERSLGTAPTVNESATPAQTRLGHEGHPPLPAATPAPATTPEVPPEAALGLELPTVDDRFYQIDRELARGGMGRIFTARDRRLGRRVAVKEVLVREEAFLARFDREVRLTARLQHPNIVTVYEAGRWPGGEPFYAMRLIGGRPLEDAMADAKTLEARLGLLPNVLAVAEALGYAHDERIIHRDLKPANVLVGRYGETVVIDWGLAKDLDDTRPEELVPGPYRGGGAEALTMLGSIMGTPSYMAPEQAQGATVDQRADVYAVGAILYQALTGKVPYSGRTAEEILVRLLREPPPPLLEVEPRAPADLVAIVERAMARDPADRYATAGALAEDLRRYTTGQLVGSHRYSTWELVRRWLRRHRAPVAVGGAAAVVLLALGVTSYIKIAAERDRADGQRVAAEAAATRADEARGTAEHAQAAMLVERARALIAAGTPARAAPLVARAEDLHADAPYLSALEGQVAAALPAVAWTRAGVVPATDKDDPIAIEFAGGATLVVETHALAAADGADAPSPPAPPAADDTADKLAASAGYQTTTGARLDPTGKLLAVATDEEVAVWDVSPLRKRAANTGCREESGTTFILDRVTRTGEVLGVCQSHGHFGRGEVVAWAPPATPGSTASKLPVIADVRGAPSFVASEDARVIATIDGSLGTAIAFAGGTPIGLRPLAHSSAVAVSGDGRFVAAGNVAGIVQVWDAASGRESAVMTATAAVRGLAFAPDGELVAAVDAAGAVTAWRLSELVAPVALHEGSVDLAATDRGPRWTATSAGTIAAFDSAGAPVASLASPPNTQLEHSALARTGIVASGKRGEAGVVWWRDHEVVLEQPTSFLSAGGDVAFTERQLVDLASGRVTELEPGFGPELMSCQTPRADRAVCVIDRHPAGLGGDDDVTLFSLPDGKEIALAGTWTQATAVAATGDLAFVGTCEDKVAVVELATGRVRAQIALDVSACPHALAASERAKLGAIAKDGGYVAVWDTATSAIVTSTLADDEVSAMTFSPSGTYLAITTAKGNVALYHARTLARVATFEPGASEVVFDADDDTLLASVKDRLIRLRWAPPVRDATWRTRAPFVDDGTTVRPRATTR